MARPATTPQQRANNMKDAIDALPGAFYRATVAHREYGATDARTLAAWSVVEIHGATVHRNGRLLAGKSKGG
jgi:hypothetical protein